MITIKVEGFDAEVSRDKNGSLNGKISQLPGCEAQAKDMRELKMRLKRAIVSYLKEVAGRKPELRKRRRGAISPHDSYSIRGGRR